MMKFIRFKATSGKKQNKTERQWIKQSDYLNLPATKQVTTDKRAADQEEDWGRDGLMV